MASGVSETVAVNVEVTPNVPDVDADEEHFDSSWMPVISPVKESSELR